MRQAIAFCLACAVAFALLYGMDIIRVGQPWRLLVAFSGLYCTWRVVGGRAP